VDVSTFGGSKTITVGGNTQIPTLQPFVTIEISVDAGGLKWAPLKTFVQAGQQVFDVACHWMRANVSNYRGGGSPSAEVGGEADGTTFQALAVPAGSGTGVASATNTLGVFKTVQVGGPFRGALNVEISEDGGATFQQKFSFSQPGIQSLSFVADQMRVTRNGVPQVDPGTPTVTIGGTNSGGGGGGGGLGVNVDNQGIAIAGNPHSTLNFTGPGVVASDAGGGVADITINGTGDLGWYGTAIDGDLHFDGAANVTIRGVVIAPVANVYTVPDTVGDIYGDTVTIDTGVTVDMAGFWLRAATEVAGDGVIANDGSAGTNGGGGSGGVGGAGGAQGTLLGGGAGADAAPAGGGAGSDGTSSTLYPSRSTGSGGNGGTAGPRAGGTGGVDVPQPGYGTYSIDAISSGDGVTGGAGGGSGAADDGAFGGGGGGAGGVVGVAAKTFANFTGTLRARGAHGGNGSGVRAGGGGGGQGGVVLIITNDNAPPTTDVTGGAAGAAAGAAGAATAGTAGAVVAISPVWGPI
jgi:hypothetical protein